MDDNREVKYRITPEFNLLYELGMPTGRQIRTAMFFIVIFLIATIAVTKTFKYFSNRIFFIKFIL